MRAGVGATAGATGGVVVGGPVGAAAGAAGMGVVGAIGGAKNSIATYPEFQKRNLSIATPLSYLRAQINTIKKKLCEDIESTLGSKLGLQLKELEKKRKTYTTFTSYTQFIINLINNKTYIELLITDIYLEKWQDQIDSQNKNGKKSDYERILKYLNQLRNEAINLKNDVEKLDLKLYNVDLTIGLFVDELFELYDYYFDEQPTMLDKYQNMFERLADRISQLVYKGFAIHILRGRPLCSQSRLMKNTIKKLRVFGRLIVLTVIGEQSSANSSLLNSTFGCNFRVSSGRCTTGVYLGIAYYKDVTIVILD
ncbi:unnamed protein product, partial [Didymodactylos carnosus]